MDKYYHWLLCVLSTGLITVKFGGANPVVTQPPGLLRRYSGETASLSWLFSETFENGGTLVKYNGQPIYQIDRNGIESIPPDYTGRVSFSRTALSVTLDLLAVTINDAAHGNYTVEQSVIGDDDISNRQAEIFIYATPTMSLTRLPSGDIIENQSVTFTCLVQPQSVPSHQRLPIEYTWRRNGQNINPPLNRHSVHNISGGQELRVEPVQRTDMSYQCVAQEQTSVLQAVSSLISIDVYYTPGTPVVSGVPTDPLIEGDSLISITCYLPSGQEGNPAVYTYLWTNMDSSYSTETSDSKLTITKLNVTLHDGPWQCQVKNAVGGGSSAAFTLTVHASPLIQADLPEFVARIINESFSESCTFKGRPEVSIDWLYNGMPSLPGGMTTSTTVISQGKYRVTSSTLTWSQATQDQRKTASGLYHCQASNTISSSTSTQMSFTSLFGPYDIAISPSENQTVVENDTVTLTCGAKCNPGCAYTWSYEGDRKLKNTHVRKFQRGQRKTGGELHLDSIGRNNNGWFICVAHNNIGSDAQGHIYISVHYPPDVVITINPSGDLVQGMDVTVLCSVDSKPPDNTITYTNVTGGHPPYYDDSFNTTHSWVTITDIDILDTGELRCTADNGVSGSPRSQQKYLEVFGPARVHQTYPSNNRTGVEIGDYVIFQVSIVARPIPSPEAWSWMFVPESFTKLSVPGGVDLIVNQDLATLTISNVTTEHFGNYSLHTSNSYGGWELGDVVFELIASGPPFRPTGFQAVRVTGVSITVEWMPGFDGGLPQTFTITYINIDSGDVREMSDIPDECPSQGCIMQRKITEDIADDAQYELQIRAHNGKGQTIGEAITVTTPVTAKLPQPPKISMGDTDAEVKFSVIGQLTDVTIHHCVKDTENCNDDQFPILNLEQNNQGRGRRQARDTMYNFSQTVDLVDPSASSYAFTVLLHDGDDIIYVTEATVSDRKGSNTGAIVGGVIGGLLLAALVVVLVVLWRKGIIFQKEKDVDNSREGERHYENMGLAPVYNEIPANIIDNSTYEDLNERDKRNESTEYTTMPKPSVHIIDGSCAKLVEVIGESTVYRVALANTEVTHQISLPKKLVSKFIKDSHKYPVHQKYLEGAVETMVKLVNCDNIINCLGLASARRELLLEHVDFGSLRQYLTRINDATYINSSDSGDSSRDLVHFIHQAANGAAAVAELEPEALFHCLSLDHVLLGVNFTIKLTGFSMAECVKAREVAEDEMRLPRPLRWLAPEAIDLMHLAESDVWSFGILMWEIMNQGEIPFSEIADISIKSHIKRGCHLKETDACTNDMYDLMWKCWKMKPEDRPPMNEVKAQLLQNTVYQNI